MEEWNANSVSRKRETTGMEHWVKQEVKQRRTDEKGPMKGVQTRMKMDVTGRFLVCLQRRPKSTPRAKILSEKL